MKYFSCFKSSSSVIYVMLINTFNDLNVLVLVFINLSQLVRATGWKRESDRQLKRLLYNLLATYLYGAI